MDCPFASQNYDKKAIDLKLNEKHLAKFKQAQARAARCKDMSFISKIYKLFEEIYERNQEYHPSVLICTPQGTGKTMLAYQLASLHFPILYFAPGCTSRADDSVAPFYLITKALLKALQSDSYLNSCHLVSNKKGDFLYRTVHLLVGIAEKMAEIKSPDWFEAELSVDGLREEQMSIEEGRIRLERLFPNQSVIVFVDEFPDFGNEEHLLKNILYKLKVIPIFATRRTSNLFDYDEDVSPRPLHRLVITSLPQFNPKLFEDLSAEMLSKFDNHPTIESILCLLKSCNDYENPQLLQSAFDFMNVLTVEYLSAHSARIVVNVMLRFLFRTFTDRLDDIISFSAAQYEYIDSFVWSKSLLGPSRLRVSKRFSHIESKQFLQNEPYFWLDRDGNHLVGTYFEKSEPCSAVNVHYPFNTTPLYGLMLFGIKNPSRLDHGPFLTDYRVYLATRITCIGAMLQLLEANKILPGDENYLAKAFTAAAVIASRGNGPDGCLMAKFLSGIISELSIVKKFPKKNSTVTMDSVVFGEKKIPFLSPVPVTEWSDHLVNFLDSILHAKCRLGTFVHYQKKQTVDHIILEFNVNHDKNKPKLTEMEKLQKSHNYIESWSGLDPKSVKEVSLITECIPNLKEYGLAEVERVILEKFERLEENYILDYTDMTTSCSTFIILAFQFEDFSNCSSDDKVILYGLNERKYYLWSLKAEEPYKYSVIPVFPEIQCERKDDFKDVIIMSVSEISGPSSWYSFTTTIEKNRYSYDDVYRKLVNLYR